MNASNSPWPSERKHTEEQIAELIAGAKAGDLPIPGNTPEVLGQNQPIAKRSKPQGTTCFVSNNS
jgi:hypothetical protein